MKFFFRIVICLLVAMLGFFQSALSQNFIQLDESYGLSEKEIYDIEESKDGIIWLASASGLIRYDGYSFEYKFHKKQFGTSVFQFFKDENERIWFVNLSNQVFYIENDEIVFFGDYYDEFKGAPSCVRIYQNKVIIVATYIKVSLTIDFYSKKRIDKKTEYTQAVIPQLFNGAFVSTQGNGNEFHLISTTTNRVDTLYSSKNKVKEAFPTEINSQLCFYFSYLKQRKKFCLLNKKGELKFLDDKLPSTRIVSANSDGNYLYYATEKGLNVCEIRNDSIVLVNSILKNEFITKTILDRSGNRWLSTLHNGVFVFPNSSVDKIFANSEGWKVKNMFRGKSDELIFITQDFRLIKLENSTRKFSEIETRAKGLDIHRVFYIDSLDQYLVSAPFYKNLLFDANFTNEVIARSTNSIKDCSVDDKGNIAVSSAVFFFINSVDEGILNTNKHKFFDPNRSNCNVYHAKRDVFYFGSNKGIFQVDTNYQSQQIDLGETNISVIDIISKGNFLFVLSAKNGIFVLKDNKVVHRYTEDNGLLSSVNKYIRISKNNHLWLAGMKGIQSVNLKTHEIKNYTKIDGISSYNFNGFEIVNDRIVASNDREILFISTISKPFNKKTFLNPYFSKISSNKQTCTPSDKKIELSYSENMLNVYFNTNGFLSKELIEYEYRIKSLSKEWESIPKGNNFISLKGLPVGNFTIELRAKQLGKTSKSSSLSFHRKNIFYRENWFFLVIFLFVFSVVFVFIRKTKKERDLKIKQLQSDKQLIRLRLESIRSQMNPHFIFNSLNSIQDLILEKEIHRSYDTVELFAQLVRHSLDYSKKEMIRIRQELSFLEIYLQLEQLRFEEDFSYELLNNVKENVFIPSLIIQPFIENALLHGLHHKDGKKRLNVLFEQGEYIICTITDNGIGREESAIIKKRQEKSYESFSTEAIKERLEILGYQYGVDLGYQYTDLRDDNNNNKILGTKVTITLPYKEF